MDKTAAETAWTRVEEGTVFFFRRGWPTLPDIRLAELEGRPWVVKDWKPRPWWRRWLQGRPMLAREHRFLRMLDDVEGVPRSGGFPDPHSLAIEFLAGRPICDLEPGTCDESFFVRLEDIVRAVHARGVVHGDLDQYDNVLVRDDGSPALIDFGGALSRGLNPLANLWHETLRLHDLHCLRLLRARFGPASIGVPDAPPLSPWQRRVLVFFQKMERRQEFRVHGRGEGPEAHAR